METLLPTQPSPYKELIKNSLALYRASFSRIILISFFLSIVAFVPRFLFKAIGQNIFLNLSPFNPSHLWLVPINLVSMIFFISIVWRMHCVIRGFHEPLIEDFIIGIKKILYVFFTTLIQSAILFAITIAFYGLFVLLNQYHVISPHQLIKIFFTLAIFLVQIVLMIYIYTLFIFLVPLITIENKGVLSSLERSTFLVWNHWWRVFSVQFTPWLSYLMILFIIRYIFQIDIHIYFTEQPAYPLGAALLNIVLFAIFVPWVAATMLTQLKDLELRKKWA
jgi:hypothetical protein